MKNIFVTVLMLCFAGAVSAQSLSRAGFYMDNGQAVYANPKGSVTISVTVEKSHFAPGVFARYAQKMLGVRASLTERIESKILSSAIYDVAPTTPLQKSVQGGGADAILPAFRADNRALSVEQQAQAAADMIFSLIVRSLSLARLAKMSLVQVLNRHLIRLQRLSSSALICSMAQLLQLLRSIAIALHLQQRRRTISYAVTVRVRVYCLYLTYLQSR